MIKKAPLCKGSWIGVAKTEGLSTTFHIYCSLLAFHGTNAYVPYKTILPSRLACHPPLHKEGFRRERACSFRLKRTVEDACPYIIDRT